MSVWKWITSKRWAWRRTSASMAMWAARSDFSGAGVQADGLVADDDQFGLGAGVAGGEAG